MRKFYFLLLLCFSFASKFTYAQPAEFIKQYIETYKIAAIEEMKRTGVPAAITLAQGIHETDAGTSKLVLKSNNHFGIKCKASWTGEWVSHDDDAIGECFRKYSSPIDSYKDHSDFLRSGARYSFLFNLDPTDCEGWCWGLKKAGYATNPKYPQILLRIISEYNLQDYTLIAMGRKSMADEMLANAVIPSVSDMVTKTMLSPKPATAYPNHVFKINDTKVIYVAKGTPFLQVADEHNISLHRLFDFNDMEPEEVALEDGLIYLQRKRRTGLNDKHMVLEGEDLYSIAQTESIRFGSLLDYNYLKENMQPQVGEVLYLKGQAPSMPRLASATASTATASTAAPVNDIVYNNNSNVSVLNSYSAHSASASASARMDEASSFIVHVVQPKETLYFISKKYEVAIDDVLKWNGLATSDLKSGQQIRINKKNANAIN